MDIQQEKVDELNALLTITLEKNDYYTNFDKTLRSYRKTMNLPGFRAGQVPVSVIKKKYGKSVLAEELQKVLNTAIGKHISDNQLQVLGQPLPVADREAGDWDEPDTFEFAYEMGLAPEFSVDLSSKHKLDHYTVKIDKKMVNEEVMRLRRRFGKLKDVEKAGDEDMLMGEFIQLQSDGLEFEGGIRNQSTIGLEYIKDRKSKKKLKGSKIGDEIEVDIHKLSTDHNDLGRMLGISHDEVHGLGDATFKFKVTAIKEMEPAELNEEFFGKLMGEEGEKTEEALRDKISEDLGKHFANDSDTLFKRDTNRYFSKKLKLSLPDEFLKKWIERSQETPMSAEDIEKSYEDYANGIKWQLIKNRIIKENEIKVEFEDAMEHTKGLLRDNYMRYGYPSPSDEELQESAMRFMQDRNETERIFDNLYEEKVMEMIKEKTKVNTKELSFDKFKDLAEK